MSTEVGGTHVSIGAQVDNASLSRAVGVINARLQQAERREEAHQRRMANLRNRDERAAQQSATRIGEIQERMSQRASAAQQRSAQMAEGFRTREQRAANIHGARMHEINSRVADRYSANQQRMANANSLSQARILSTQQRTAAQVANIQARTDAATLLGMARVDSVRSRTADAAAIAQVRSAQIIQRTNDASAISTARLGAITTRTADQSARAAQIMSIAATRSSEATRRANEASRLSAVRLAAAQTASAERTQMHSLRTARMMSGIGTSGGSISAASGGIANLASMVSLLSTRMGVLAFNAQLVGMSMTTAFTMPLAAVGILTTSLGMGFAVAVDQATAGLKAMLPAGYDVEALLRRMADLALRSPAFSTKDVITYTQKLVAAGQPIKQTEAMLSALSNIFSTFGVAGDKAGLAMLGVSQIFQKGKVQGEELTRQISQQLPIWKLLAEGMGVTQKELTGMVRAGKVSSEDFAKAMIKVGNTKTYVLGAASAAVTLGGAWQIFKETFEQQLGFAFLANKGGIIESLGNLSDALQPLVEYMISKLPAAINAMARFSVKLKEWGQAWDSFSDEKQDKILKFLLVLGALGPVALIIGQIGTAVSALGSALSFLLAVGGLKDGTRGSAGGVAGAFRGLGPVAASGTVAVLALAAAIALTYKNSKHFRDGITSWGEDISKVWSGKIAPAFEKVKLRLDELGESLDRLFGEGTIARGFADVLGGIGMAFSYAVLQILFFWEKMSESLTHWVDWAKVGKDEVVKLWDEYFPKFKETWDKIVQKAKTTWDQLYRTGSDLWEKVTTAWDKALKKITEVWDHFYPGMKEQWDEAWGKLTDAWDKVVTAWDTSLKPALDALWKTVTEDIIPALEDIYTAMEPVSRLIEEKLEPAVKKLKESMDEQFVNNVKLLALTIVGVLWVAFQGLIALINNTALALNILAFGMSIFSQHMTESADAVAEAWRTVATFVETIWLIVADTWRSLWDDLTNDILGAVTSISTGVTGLGNAFTSAFGGMILAAQSLQVGVVSAFQRMALGAAGAVNQLIGAVNSAIAAMNMLSPVKAGFVGGVEIPKPKSSLRGFATGGKVYGAGTETSDSILSRLSKNEWVINATSAKSIGDSALNFMNNTGRIPVPVGLSSPTTAVKPTPFGSGFSKSGTEKPSVGPINIFIDGIRETARAEVDDALEEVVVHLNSGKDK